MVYDTNNLKDYTDYVYGNDYDDYDTEDDYDDEDEPTSVIESLKESVIMSVENAGDDISPTDMGAVHLAIKYASQIDEALKSDNSPERTNALYLGPQLLAVLKELKLTPAARAQEIGTNPKAYAESAASKVSDRAKQRAEERNNKD